MIYWQAKPKKGETSIILSSMMNRLGLWNRQIGYSTSELKDYEFIRIGKWSLEGSDDVRQNCFNSGLCAGGTLLKTDGLGALVLFGLRDLFDIEFADDDGNLVSITSVEDVEKIFSENFIHIAKKLGIHISVEIVDSDSDLEDFYF